MKILISARSKTKLVEVPKQVHLVLSVLKVFFPPETPVVLGKYTFSIGEIDPWPPAPPPVQKKMF